jgi:hypothetical protein
MLETYVHRPHRQIATSFESLSTDAHPKRNALSDNELNCIQENVEYGGRGGTLTGHDEGWERNTEGRKQETQV